jgi:hypothetical protein
MTHDVLDERPATLPARWRGFLREVLASSLDIRSIWWIGHAPLEERRDAPLLQLLAFGSAAVLERLRKRDPLRRPDVELLVVLDGDAFASAWGPSLWTGSLARWAWRETSPGEAYYDESRWAQAAGKGGTVVRVRRKAILLWRQQRGDAEAAKRVYKE